MISKAELRGEARRRLREVTSEERESAGNAIAQRIWTVREVASARVILLYAAAGFEAPTDSIADEALRRGLVVTYPRCLPETSAMTLHSVAGLEELRVGGSYGIREPDLACPLVSVEEIDVVLVPGLAWDRSGNRLGKGAGYYDRLFAIREFRAHRCGIFLERQEIPDLPADPWDQPLHSVVTEREVVRMGA